MIMAGKAAVARSGQRRSAGVHSLVGPDAIRVVVMLNPMIGVGWPTAEAYQVELAVH